MTAQEIVALGLPGAEAGESADGMPTIVVAREHLVEVSRALRDTPALRFAFLSDISCTDYRPREPRFEVIYLLVCLGVPGWGDVPKRLRMKVRVPGDDIRVPSVTSVWPAAGWPERELYDFFGIVVSDHPDLRRLLMPEDWEGYPMRKDYPVQIKQPVKLTHALQLSEEQFVANIQAARDRVAGKGGDARAQIARPPERSGAGASRPSTKARGAQSDVEGREGVRGTKSPGEE